MKYFFFTRDDNYENDDCFALLLLYSTWSCVLIYMDPLFILILSCLYITLLLLLITRYSYRM